MFSLAHFLFAAVTSFSHLEKNLWNLMNNNLEKILSNLMNNNLEKQSYEILWITIWKKNLIKSYE